MPDSLLNRVVSSAGNAAGRASVEFRSLKALTDSGVLKPESPRQIAAALRALARYGPIGAAPTRAALRDPQRIGLVDELGELTFTEIDRRTNAIANAWRDAGIGAGDGVAILCRNHRGMIDASFAAAKIGARALYLNTDFAGPQVTDVAAREGTDALVYDEEFAPIVADAAAPRGKFVAWHDGDVGEPTLDDLITAGSTRPPPKPSESAKVIMLTSGTTGTPKGAPRETARSLAPVGALLGKVPFKTAESTYVAAPMFHALGYAHAILATSLASTIVMRRRFDPDAVLTGVAEQRCTALVVVPVMLARILSLGPERLAEADTGALRIIFCSGAQLEADLAIRAREAFGDVVYNLYGSTEVAYATIATPDELRAAPGCAGTPPMGARVRLFDDDGREVKGTHKTGRIFVGNTFQFDGYTGGGTKEVIDGMMSSGDVGHFDEAGRLFVDGRDDEMIVSGGENVFPREVEELLAGHPAINEAALIGVPDEEFGKRLHAFVALNPGEELSAKEIQDFVKANLARYKVPRAVDFLDQLPRNPSGKVLKRELVGMVGEEAGAK